MQIVFRNNIKDDRVSEYIEWVKEHRASFDEHAPAGWSYAGTYVTVYNLGTHEVESRWDLDDYAALAPAEMTEAWNRLVVDSSDFFVSGVGQTSLMKGVDDVRVLE